MFTLKGTVWAMKKLEYIAILVFILTICIQYQGAFISPPKDSPALDTNNLTYSKLLKNIDQLLYSENKYEEALALINESLEKTRSFNDIKTANILFRKSEIFVRMEKPEEAITTLHQALLLKMNPDQRIYTYSNLAGICSHDSRKIEALAYIKEADKIISKSNLPDNFFGSFEFHYHKGTLMLDMGNYKEAVKNFKEALKIQPENDQIMIELAFCLFRNEQVAEAREVASQWLSFKNMKVDSLEKSDRAEMDSAEDMARYYMILGDYDKALAIVNEVKVDSDAGCNMDPELANIYYYSGDYYKAETVLLRMINNKHSDSWEINISKKLLRDINGHIAQHHTKRGLSRKKSMLKIMLIRGIRNICERQLICCNLEVRA